MSHRFRARYRSEYAEEKKLVRMLAFHDSRNKEVVARETLGMHYFLEGEVLITPRHDGSLQLQLST